MDPEFDAQERLTVGPHVRLRTTTPDDYPFIYLLENEASHSFRWRLRGQSLDPDRSMKSFWEGLLVALIGESTEMPGQRLMLAIVYDADLRNGHAKFAIASPPDVPSARKAEGAALFLSYCFSVFPLRKLYAEVPGFNLPRLRVLDRPPFIHEGCYHDHDFFENKYWDRHWYSISRDWS